MSPMSTVLSLIFGPLLLFSFTSVPVGFDQETVVPRAKCTRKRHMGCEIDRDYLTAPTNLNAGKRQDLSFDHNCID